MCTAASTNGLCFLGSPVNISYPHSPQRYGAMPSQVCLKSAPVCISLLDYHCKFLLCILLSWAGLACGIHLWMYVEWFVLFSKNV